MSDIKFIGTWHQLSEKLPEHYSDVIIAFKDGDVFGARFENDNDPLFHWYPFNHILSDNVDLFDGAYWCYMPKHPNYKEHVMSEDEKRESDEFTEKMARIIQTSIATREQKKIPAMLRHIEKCVTKLEAGTIDNIEYIAVSESVYNYVQEHHAKKIQSEPEFLGIKLKLEPSFNVDRFHFITKWGGVITTR